MARSRTVKPAFFLNEQLADVSITARLFYVGLWTQADCRGVLEDRPKRLKAALFPYDSVDIGQLIDELINAGVLIRYEADELALLCIPTLSKHQHFHRDEKPSHLPLPRCDISDDMQNPVQTPCKYDANPVLASGQHGASTPVICNQLSVIGNSDSNESDTKKRATKISLYWVPNEGLLKWAQDKYPTIDALGEVPAFIDHHIAKGTLSKCWDASFRTWIRYALKWSRPQGSIPTDPPKPVDTTQRDALLATTQIQNKHDPYWILPSTECKPHAQWATVFVYQGRELTVQDWEPMEEATNA